MLDICMIVNSLEKVAKKWDTVNKDKSFKNRVYQEVERGRIKWISSF